MGNLVCGGGVLVWLSAVALQGYFSMLDVQWFCQAGSGHSLSNPHHSKQLLMSVCACHSGQLSSMLVLSFFSALSRKPFKPFALSLFLSAGFEGTALLMRCTQLPDPQPEPAAVGCSSYGRTFPLFPPLVDEALVMWTQSFVSVQLSLV